MVNIYFIRWKEYSYYTYFLKNVSNVINFKTSTLKLESVLFQYLYKFAYNKTNPIHFLLTIMTFEHWISMQVVT